VPIAEEVAFEGLLEPFMLDARRALARRTAGCTVAISSAALTTLERRLLRRLSSVLAPPLAATFGLGRLLSREVMGDSRTPLYAAFEAAMRAGGLESVLAEYPVANRLARTVIANWVGATCELFERLARDRAAIARALGRDDELEAVAAIVDLASDPHSGGRSVVGLRFQCGAAVVYKPRDVRVELAVAQLLRWMGERGLELCPRPLWVLPRDGYGWVEYASAHPCRDEDAVKRFHARAGALLAVSYALAATDLHADNVLAMGEHPVLADVEMLMHPVTHPLDAPLPDGAQTAAANRRLSDTVLATGLLPAWAPGADGRLVDFGGFGGGNAEGASLAALRWFGIGTDELRLAPAPVRPSSWRNSPRLRARPIPASMHVEDFVSGFRRAYKLLLRDREHLLAPGGPVEAMRHVEIRCVFRTTRFYVSALQRLLLSQECLRSEGAWRAALESFLARAGSQYLVGEERRALNDLDVPRFTVRADARSHPCYGSFALSGFELAVDRIERLGPQDLQRQAAIIRSALHVKRPTAAAAPVASPRQATASGRPPDEDAIVNWTLALADRIAATAVRTDDGTASWIVNHRLPGGELRPSTSGLGLYAGAPGTALFLAALAHVTGISTHERLVYEALKPARRAVHDDPELLVQALGIGGLAGVTSLGHTLAVISAWMDDDALMADAHAAFALSTVERLTQDTSYDVVGGAAGAILALIAHHERTGEPWPLDRALAAAARLLDAAQRPAREQLAWPAFSGRPHGGFAHGASGTALALARLWQHAPQPQLLEAIAGALEFERSLYRPDRQDWQVTDVPTSTAGMLTRGAWCYGAPGVLLARLGIRDALDAGAAPAPEELRDAAVADVQTALAATLRLGEAALDGLCCGTAGRIEATAAAARDADDAGMALRARHLAAGVMQRTASSPALDATMFTGVAGIGYALLRLDRAQELPSVLVLEGSPPG
jgi:class II lanthipeptide synthase